MNRRVVLLVPVLAGGFCGVRLWTSGMAWPVITTTAAVFGRRRVQ